MFIPVSVRATTTTTIALNYKILIFPKQSQNGSAQNHFPQAKPTYRDHLTLHRHRRPSRPCRRRRCGIGRGAAADRRWTASTAAAFCGGDGGGGGGGVGEDAGAGLLIELDHRSMRGPP